MKKILLILLICFKSLFGYITTDLSESTTGSLPETTLTGTLSSCSSNCSNVWHYNATTTQNLKDNDTSGFANSDIITDNKYKAPKDLTISEFVEKGISFFKTQHDKGSSAYNVFMLVREVKDNNITSETLMKNGNDFSITDINKENQTIYLNSENVFNSYLFGQIEVNSGLITAYTYRNRIVKLNGTRYHFIELEQVNFLNSLVAKYNEYCSNSENFNFPFIYEPSNFYYTYTNLVNGTEFDPTADQNVYPDGVSDYAKTGLIAIPCDSDKIGDNPYTSLKNMKIFLNPDKITYFDAYSGFNTDDIIDNVENYFYDDGFALKIAIVSEKELLQIGASFFTAIMQENKIESGIIIKSKSAEIANKYWTSGKCPTHYNRKTFTMDSEAYFLSSLSYEMPFNEMLASFNIANSTEISSYSPIASFPNNEETIYAFTPDNHVLSHSLTKYNYVLDSIFSGNTNFDSEIGFTGTFIQTRTYQQKCKSFGVFSFILVIIAVVVTIYSAGLAAGLWTPIMTGGTTIVEGMTVTAISNATIGSAILGITATNALTYAVLGSLVIYSTYNNIWTGTDTSPSSSTLQDHSYNKIIDNYLQTDAIISGSNVYQNFYNLKSTMNNFTEKILGMTPKEYAQITENSFLYDTTVTTNENEIFGFNTSNEINYLYGLTFSHAEPATLPPEYRYFKYSSLDFDASTFTNLNPNEEPLNVAKMENNFLGFMYGFYGSGSGTLDVFKTKQIMENTLEIFSKNDIIKYDN